MARIVRTCGMCRHFIPGVRKKDKCKTFTYGTCGVNVPPLPMWVIVEDMDPWVRSDLSGATCPCFDSIPGPMRKLQEEST